MENRVLYQLGMALPLAIATIVGFTENNPVFAQLTPDNTLGAEGSIVTPQQLRDLIQGGAIRDGALFHSFDEFNVGDGRGVFFDLQNNTDILNIFTRVTGGNVSNILGTLGVLQDALNSDVLGNANLFLLNPNGITFGQNASLQLNGSFFATTADGFGFDNFTFSASAEEAPPPLLTISIPRSLSFRDNPGDIVNQSIVPSTINPNVFDGLRVPNGQSLVLVGGDVNLQGGSLRAPGGRIEIGGLAEAGNVGINVDGSSISLSFPDGVTRGDVSLTALGNAIPEIDVTAGGGGDIAIADTENIGNAGDININVRDGVILEGTNLSASPSGPTDIVPSQITTTVENALGEGGNINISAGSLLVTDRGFIRTSTFGQGNAGDLTINVDNSVTLDSGLIGADDQDEIGGAVGTLLINADSIFLDNSAELTAVSVTEQGNIALNSESIILRRGSIINTDASTSTGGNITINTGVLAGLENSDITSNSVRGQGGFISITAEGVFGLQVRDQLTAQSDITAFSELGAQFSGQVVFNTPQTNPTQEQIEEPEALADPSEIVAQTACYDFGGDSQLSNTGRGGVPQIPGFIIRNDVVDVELVDEVPPAPPPEAIKPHHRTDVVIINSEGEEIKPAMGAVLLPNGMVEFVDYNPAEVYRDMYAAAGCSGR